jgi:hypothetical protein
MDIIWFEMKERYRIKLFFAVAESRGAKESHLEAKNAEGWLFASFENEKPKCSEPLHSCS